MQPSTIESTTSGQAVLAELRSVLTSLGKNGGLCSASVYDTARLICLAPPPEGSHTTVEWLLAEQCADGGWGDPQLPVGRDISSLAAALALRAQGNTGSIRDSVNSALELVITEAERWADLRAEAYPVAAEVVMPYLLEEANLAGLKIPTEPYRPLFAIRDKKLQALNGRRVKAGTAPSHSWEALGLDFDPELPDGTGGVGHSPAATAAWLKTASDRPSMSQMRRAAQRFLVRSQCATGLNLPGVVPTVWPYPGFDLAYGLYVLLLNDLLALPSLEDVIKPLVDRLTTTLERDGGVGMSQYFVTDGDLTFTAISVLACVAGQNQTSHVLQFSHKDHFYTYINEQTPSLLSNAHAVFALNCCGQRHPSAEDFILKQQTTSGNWLSEKWHSSWRYATMEVIAALAPLGHRSSLKNTLGAFLSDQHEDGGWGIDKHSIPTETAFSVGALRILEQHGLMDEQGRTALAAGQSWLLDNYRPYTQVDCRHWIGKELYAQPRINRLYELCAIYRTLIDGTGVPA